MDEDMLSKMDSAPVTSGRRPVNKARQSVAHIPDKPPTQPPQETVSPTPEPTPGNPIKKVMDVIQNLQDDGSKNKHMQGHIDKGVMDDTFLVNAEHKVPDSTLAINCQDHNRPAVFFSQKLNSWRCFLCMMSQEGLVYVDKQYKHDMEDYEAIKAATYRTVVENTPAMTLVQVWKSQIRQTLVQVRKEFNDWIDNFTHKFVRSLNKIETSKEMIEYADQDRLLSIQVLQLQNRYKRILQIFEKISTAQPDKKLDTIQMFKKEMREIEAAVQAQDKNIKSTAVKVKKALRETVELDSLGLKVLQKYQKFLQHKVNIKIEEAKVNGGSKVTDPDELNLGGLDFQQSVSDGAFLTTAKTNFKLDNEAQLQKLTTTKQAQFYDADRQSTIHFMKPGTSSIYLFNHEKQEFVAESLKFSGGPPLNHPQNFTTAQLVKNDNIYMIGGLQTTNDPRDYILLPYCRMIDANLNLVEKAQMKSPRCSIPLAVIRDRWILAIGGLIGRNKACTLVAAYDTVLNAWFDCQSLTTPRYNCTAIVLSERHIYLMPGANPGAVRGTSLMIDYLDCGPTQDFNAKQIDQANYGAPLARKNWESLEVKDPSFFRAQPVCGFSVADGNKVIIFGGQSVSQFIFQQQDVSNGQVAVKPMRGNFKEKPGFCQGSDTVIKMYNQKLYALDASALQLHIFDVNLAQWSTNSLQFYKVPIV